MEAFQQKSHWDVAEHNPHCGTDADMAVDREAPSWHKEHLGGSLSPHCCGAPRALAGEGPPAQLVQQLH